MIAGRLLDLLFITDRAPADQAGDLPYTAGRSRSMAFGSAIIEFGEGVSWDVLVKESTATQRVNPLRLKARADHAARSLSGHAV
jgi:hypothetical protein